MSLSQEQTSDQTNLEPQDQPQLDLISDHQESSPSPQSQPQQPDSTPQVQSELPDSVAAEAVGEVDVVPVAWPDPTGWESIEDLDVGGLPEASRPHFERLQELHANRVNEWNTEREKVDSALSELEDARSTFHRLIESMDETGDTKAVAVELERYRGGFGNMASENVALAQRIFRLEHPDFDRYPVEIRKKWADEMTDDSFYSRYRGETIYDKMKESWKFQVFRNNAKPAPPPQPKPQARARTLPVASHSGQGLVADGTRASAMPTPDAEDMSFQDILNMHDHLLKG